MKKLFQAVMGGLTAASAVGMIVYSGAVAEAVRQSVYRCAAVIVPSLFAFMALSKLMTATGLLEKLSLPLDMTLGRLLRIPRGGTGLFLISNIAGYPVGGAMLSQLTESGRISKPSAEAMQVYCYGGGPAFTVSAIGVGIYQSPRAGLTILLSVISANMLLAIAVNTIYKPEIVSAGKKSPKGSALISSVTEAGEGILDMCFMIIFFSAAMAVAEQIGAFDLICKALDLTGNEAVIMRSVFEITSAAELSSASLGTVPALAAVCSFGGLCVILQLSAAVRGRYSLRPFLMWMPLRIGMAAGFGKLYSWIFLDNAVPTFAKSGVLIVEMNNLLPSICLIMMIFILVLQKRLDFLRGL